MEPLSIDEEWYLDYRDPQNIRWPDAINVHLWPYALHCANETRNTTPTKGHDQCPLSRFNGSDITPS
jgi:hypothetical protein